MYVRTLLHRALQSNVKYVCLGASVNESMKTVLNENESKFNRQFDCIYNTVIIHELHSDYRFYSSFYILST